MDSHKDCFPRISTVFETSTNFTTGQLYVDVIRNTLKRILPSHIFNFKSKKDEAKQLQEFKELLPLVTWSEFDKIPFNLSFFLLSTYRANAFKFFFEMISRWLVPGKRLNVVLFFAVDFRLPDLSDEVYTIAELMVRIDNQKDLESIQNLLPIIGTEIRLGVASVYHATRILEFKGLSADEKIAMIQESIAALTRKKAAIFEYDIFSQMQQFLISCSDRFKAVHEYHHMSRIICFHYLFRRALKNNLVLMPNKRQVSVKFLKARLHLPGGIKRVLGVVVAINLFGDHEIFEERQLVRAVQNVIPRVRGVEDSFFANISRSDPVRTLYVEVEKNEGEGFTLEDFKKLKRELPNELKRSIERRLHPIFMPRNEEEIMRNIVTLSNQLKYVRDIPQMIISFDEQTDKKVSFTIILLRVLKPDSLSLQEIFRQGKTFLECLPDRTKIVGSLRKKYAKEADVFRVRVNQEQFLRGDHSVDLYKARQAIVFELTTLFGDIRDYNGGMISKENELFSTVKELLGGVAKHHQLLLENFFYALNPIVMRSVLEPLLLKTFFLLLLDAMDDGFPEHGNYLLKVHQESGALFMIIAANDPTFKEFINFVLESLNLSSIELASVDLVLNDMHCLGFLYRNPEREKRMRFYFTVEQAMKTWDKQ